MEKPPKTFNGYLCLCQNRSIHLVSKGGPSTVFSKLQVTDEVEG